MESKPDISDSSLFAIREPYPGLRPFSKKNRDMFFGRDAEREILIDKILSHKLTLLFSATGVGKSSLLRASVLPELERPTRENLDVVYHWDWVRDPKEALTENVIQALQELGKVDGDFRPDESLGLKHFFRGCVAFSSSPLVIVLDQFEEFFQYHRYAKNFGEFVEDLSACVSDRETATTFVISMREDFALELNAFKPHLPTTLFENFFRLEKLKIDKAEAAIRLPAEKLGYAYEETLLKELLKDLAERAKEAEFGKAGPPVAGDMPEVVEPPYIQIVCAHLWKAEHRNPAKTIRLETYREAGRAEGIVDSHFETVMENFSSAEKQMASRSFDFLVTPYGTKMAYTPEELGRKIRADKTALENMLKKLSDSRILRYQKRGDEVWYELYHDIFSRIIRKWNDAYKYQQMIKKGIRWGAAGVFAVILLVLAFNAYVNLTNHHFRLERKTGPDAIIELHRGTAKGSDYFGLRRFECETGFEWRQVEPDKIIETEHVDAYESYTEELVQMLPIEDRITAYWECGNISMVEEMARSVLDGHNLGRKRKVIRLLASLGTEEAFNIIKPYLIDTTNYSLLTEILGGLVSFPARLTVPSVTILLGSKDSRIKNTAISTLGRIGNGKSLTELVKILDSEQPWDVRRAAVKALGQIGNQNSIGYLSSILKNDPEWDVRREAAVALGKIGGPKISEPLILALQDKASNVRSAAIYSLSEIKEMETKYFIDALKDQEPKVRRAAVVGLSKNGNEKLVRILSNALKDDDKMVRVSSAEGLGSVGSMDGISALESAIDDQEAYVRQAAASSLGKIGNVKGVPFLLKALNDKDSKVRLAAFKSLEEIGIADSISFLLNDSNYTKNTIQNVSSILYETDKERMKTLLSKALKDQDLDIRYDTALILGKNGSADYRSMLENPLKDQSVAVRFAAAWALGKIGETEGLPMLSDSLKDQQFYPRVVAASSIGKIGNNKGTRLLADSLYDRDGTVRRAAAFALGEIGCRESIEYLINALKDQDSDVRFAAVLGIGLVDSVESIPFLSETLNDPSPDVRLATLSSLNSIDTMESKRLMADAFNALHSDEWGSALYEGGWLFILENNIEIQIDMLKDNLPDVQTAAIKALVSNIGGESQSILPALLKDNDPFIRSAAVLAVGEIANVKDIYLLSDALNSTLVC